MPVKTKPTTSFRKAEPGVAVKVTMPAQRLMGLENVQEFVKVLTWLMKAMGAKGAYVGKRGDSLDIYLYAPDGWTFHTKLQRY